MHLNQRQMPSSTPSHFTTVQSLLLKKKKINRWFHCRFGNFSIHFQCKWMLLTSAHSQLHCAESSVSVRCFSLCVAERHQSVSVSSQSPQLSTPCLQASFILSQKEARHILINYKGDAAGGSDANQVGDDAFVETNGAFVPAEKGRKKMLLYLPTSESEIRTACWTPLMSGSVSYLHVRPMTSRTPLYLLCWSCRRARTTWYGYVVATANSLDNAAIVIYSNGFCLHR